MSNTDGWAIIIAIASAALAAASLAWSIASWQRDGPRFRVHALLYRQVLLIWIFNSGRSAAQIEHLVLGGRRGGIGGYDLTHAAQCPLLLAPGQSARLTLDPAQLPADRRRAAERGWDSLWLLLGSMQQRRAEVLPVPSDQPPTVGWRLAPRGAQLSRYRPLLATIVLLVSSTPGPGSTSLRAGGPAVLLVLLGLGVLVRAGRFQSQRQKAERWILVMAFVLAIIVGANWSNHRLIGWIINGYLTVAVLLAWPGAVGEILDRIASARRRIASFIKSPT